MSEVIEKMITTYGIDPTAKKSLDENSFPDFAQNSDGSEIVFFKENIRPIMIDLNNNAFIGWINWVPNVKRLTTLWSLCFELEKITVNLDFLRLKQNDKGVSVVSTKNGLLTLQNHPEYTETIEDVKASHELMKDLWFNWLILNKIN